MVGHSRPDKRERVASIPFRDLTAALRQIQKNPLRFEKITNTVVYLISLFKSTREMAVYRLLPAGGLGAKRVFKVLKQLSLRWIWVVLSS